MKNIKLLLFIILIVVMSTVLVACNNTTSQGDTPSDNDSNVDNDNIIEEHIHEYGNWVLVTMPSETETGSIKRVCSTCNAEETYDLPVINANNYKIQKIEPTCTNEGSLTITLLSEDIDFSTTMSIDKLPHTYVNKYDEVSHYQECSVCGDKKDVEAHSYGEWIVDVEPTCKAEGSQHRVCKCGRVESATIPKTNHSYVYKYDDMIHWKECSVCGEKTNSVPHSYGEWIVDSKPTCKAEGSQHRVCKCGRVESATIPKTNHSYAYKYDDMIHWKECSVCGATFDIGEHEFDKNHKCTICGYTDKYSGFTFAKNNADEYILTRYIGDAEIVEIPASYNGLPVTSINGFGFYNNSTMKKVVIPSTIKTLGLFAFNNCTALESIDIPSSVIDVNINALCGTESLKSINVDAENPVYRSEGNCLINKDNLLVAGCMNSVIPEGVTAISNNAFVRVTGLTSINIPSTVESFNIYPNYEPINIFYSCKNLSEINLSPSNKTFVFENNCLMLKDRKKLVTALNNAVIASSIDSFAPYALSSVKDFDSVTIEQGNTKFKKENNAIIDTINNSIAAGSSKTVIPSYVTSIDSFAFVGCEDLKSIVISDNITRIGMFCFAGSGLSEVVLSNNIDRIEIGAFSNCVNLKRIVIPKGVRFIGQSAFGSCESLEEVVFEKGSLCDTIMQDAFTLCKKLVSITNLPTQNITIEQSSFCPAIKDIIDSQNK